MDKDWNEIRGLAGEYARENMENGLNCCESVYEALIRSGALDASLDTVASATGFGGGGGAAGLTCGALAGAILANSMVHGRKNPAVTVPDDIRKRQLKKELYRRYNGIVSDFVKVNGSGLCREILDNYSYTDLKRHENCVNVCFEAAKIAVDYLQMDADEAKNLEYDPAVIGIKGFLPVK